MTMEYVYGVMLLHAAKQPITEEHLKKVVEASGAKFDSGTAKALVSSLHGVDIDKAISEAAMPVAVAAPAAHAPAEKKKEEKKEEDTSAAAGLGALFG